MNVALLISELCNSRIMEICQGASLAAKRLGITLVIVPGGKLINIQDTQTLSDQLYALQNNLNYNYVINNNFDAVIVDIDEIGRNVIILKKEAFLNKFGDIPVLTLSEMEGYLCAAQGNERVDRQIGYNAVYRTSYYFENQKFPIKIENEMDSSFLEQNNRDMFNTSISKMAETLLLCEQKKEVEYSTVLNRAIRTYFNNAAVFIYDEQENISDTRWNIPEYTNICAMVSDGNIVKNDKENIKIKTADLVKNLNLRMEKNKVWIMKNIFLEERQLGLGFYEIDEELMIPGTYSLISAIIAGSIKIERNGQKKTDLEKELLECQEELARDDSVLDHIGDRDQMTGIYNRRGFFAAAYDRLKQKFLQGTFAIVAYIDIDSIKNINEIYGREEGDYAVKRVSDILNTVFGQECVIGRIRGDEFAILLISEAEGRAEEFRSQMTHQNALLMSDVSKPYLMHLQFSICEFQYSDTLLLRDMLMETDNNLKKIKIQEQNNLIE